MGVISSCAILAIQLIRGHNEAYDIHWRLKSIVEDERRGVILEQELDALPTRLSFGDRQMQRRVAELVLDVGTCVVREQQLGCRVVAAAHREEQWC